MKIERVMARELYDSQGWPTVHCEIVLSDGSMVSSSVPTGTSRSRYEAVELRDGGKRLDGKGVRKSVEIIEHTIAPRLIGKEPEALELDLMMIALDGTPDKSRLGSNTLLAVSMALYRAQAVAENLELYELFAALFDAETVSMPLPIMNLINGGAHANNNLQIQEFSVVPTGAATFRTAFEAGVMVFHELGNLLKSQGRSTAVGLEGGYACAFASEKEALDMLLEAINRTADQHNVSCVIALDVAASQFCDPQLGMYKWHDAFISSDELIAYYESLMEHYPIYALEDGLSEDDWDGWIKLTKLLGHKAQIVADDLFATNPERIAHGAHEKAATTAIIKPNQVGTVTEAIQSISVCKVNGLNVIVSHRSEETEDTFIADLAVGMSAGQIKAGSCSRSERVAKYNRLLTIEDELTFSLLDR